MASVLWMVAVLVLQGCHSYILLTANLDDVQALAKQISESPVAGQINTIIRRASSLFNQQLRASGRPDDADDHTRYPRTNHDLDSSLEQAHDERRHQAKPHRHRHNRRSQTNNVTGLTELRTELNQELALHEEDDPQAVTENNKEIEVSPGNDHSSDKQRGEEGESTNENQLKATDNQITKKSDELNEGQKDWSSRINKMDESQRTGRLRSKYIERRSQTDEVVQLGKNASFYLNSIKKIIENV